MGSPFQSGKGTPITLFRSISHKKEARFLWEYPLADPLKTNPWKLHAQNWKDYYTPLVNSPAYL